MVDINEYLVKFPQSLTRILQTLDTRTSGAKNVLEYIDSSQHYLINAGSTDGQNSTLVTDGFQLALDENPTGIVTASGTFLVTDVLTKTAGCSLRGTGPSCVFKAGAGFPTTHTAHSVTFDAPILYCDDSLFGGRISNSGNFILDGNALARNGMVISGGATHEYGNIRVQGATVQGFVFDGCQNSVYRKLFGYDCGDRTYYAINGTYNCIFLGCDGSANDVNNLEADDDANYPASATAGLPAGMEECTWLGGIMEHQVSGTQLRNLLLTKGQFNTFIGQQYTADKVSVCAIETGTATAKNLFLNPQFWGNGVEFPAIIDRGFKNVYSGPTFSKFGTTTLVDLIEVYNQADFDRPHFVSNINVTGKLIANKGSSGSQGVSFIPNTPAGNTAQRPTGIDANYQYWDSTTKKLLTWDYAASNWVDAQGVTV